MFQLKPINNHLKYKIKTKNEKVFYDIIHHGELFENIPSVRCMIIGPSGSGKTLCLENIMQHFLTPKTNLFFVSSTKDYDQKQKRIYKKQIKQLDKKDQVPHIVKVYDDGLSFAVIDDVLKIMIALDKIEKDIIKAKNTLKKKKGTPVVLLNRNAPKLKLKEDVKSTPNPILEEEEQPHIKKFYAKHVVIIDDADVNILNSIQLYNCWKKIRHFGGSIFALSQSWNDFNKRLRSNSNVIILCPGIPVDKLRDIYDEIIHKYPWIIFRMIYNHISKIIIENGKKKHDYLMIFRDSQNLRKNLNEDIIVKDETLSYYWNIQENYHENEIMDELQSDEE